MLSRYYQLLSDGMLGFRQARKVEDIPFPWPYQQAVSAYLFLFAMLFPLVLSHFANCGADRTCDNPTWWVGPTLSFITVTSYVTLQQVARALEDPFVHPPNDLPANAMQARTGTLADHRYDPRYDHRYDRRYDHRYDQRHAFVPPHPQ